MPDSFPSGRKARPNIDHHSSSIENGTPAFARFRKTPAAGIHVSCVPMERTGFVIRLFEIQARMDCVSCQTGSFRSERTGRSLRTWRAFETVARSAISVAARRSPRRTSGKAPSFSGPRMTAESADHPRNPAAATQRMR